MQTTIPEPVTTRFYVAVGVPDGAKAYNTYYVLVELLTYNLGQTLCTFAFEGLMGHLLVNGNALSQEMYDEIKKHLRESFWWKGRELLDGGRADMNNICTF